MREAIEARDWPRALELALAAWRRTRAVELADLVDELTARIGGEPVPHRSLHAAWITRAMPYDPLAIGPLAAVASRQLDIPLRWDDVAARHGTSVVLSRVKNPPHAGHLWGNQLPILDRLAAIDAWHDDPRTTAILVRWLADGAVSMAAPNMQALYAAIADQLVRLRDVRATAALEGIVREPRGPGAYTQGLQRELATHVLRHLVQPAADAAAAALVELVRPPPAADLSGLWREVARLPDDDSPRLVLADALIERGDPRGELIALQLAGRDGGNLLRRHWHDWLGDLALLLTRRGSVFRRGMLDEIQVGMHATPSWAYDAVRGHRELSVVQRVRAHQLPPADFARFVDGLDHDIPRIGVLDDAFIYALADARPRWETRELEWSRSFHRGVGPPLAVTGAKIVAAMPALEVLELPDGYSFAPDELAALVRTLHAQLPNLRRIAIARRLAEALPRDVIALVEMV